MSVDLVDSVQRDAAALRQALDQLLRTGARPAADGLRVLAVADALDRVLLALAAIAAGEPAGAAVGASAELQAAAKQARALVGAALARRLDALVASLEGPIARLASVATRGGSVRAPPGRGQPSTQPPAQPQPQPAESVVPLAEPIEPVRFGASAPQHAARGESFVARFVAYRPAEAAAAAAALARPGDSTQTLDVGAAEIRRGAHLRVTLRAAGLRIEDGDSAMQEFVWRGQRVTLQFAVEVPKRARAGATLLKFDVSIDGLQVAGVRLEFTVGAPAASAPVQSSQGSAPVRSAFASYSSSDRERVLDRVAAIRIAVGTRVFLDCHDLRPGEKWEPALAREIDACETFMLFWSNAASRSRWVTWEWQRALDRKGLDALQIHPLDNGIPVPRDLESVHVGDPYMDLRAANAARRSASPTQQESVP